MTHTADIDAPQIAGVNLAHEAYACDETRCSVYTFRPTEPGKLLASAAFTSGCPVCGSAGFPVLVGLTTRVTPPAVDAAPLGRSRKD